MTKLPRKRRSASTRKGFLRHMILMQTQTLKDGFQEENVQDIEELVKSEEEEKNLLVLKVPRLASKKSMIIQRKRQQQRVQLKSKKVHKSFLRPPLDPGNNVENLKQRRKRGKSNFNYRLTPSMSLCIIILKLIWYINVRPMN